jgi:8-oxo-dGTP pyrophosphatase MutT (NUDIX family)
LQIEVVRANILSAYETIPAGVSACVGAVILEEHCLWCTLVQEPAGAHPPRLRIGIIGGGVEAGESPVTGLHREILEESGAEAEIILSDCCWQVSMPAMTLQKHEVVEGGPLLFAWMDWGCCLDPAVRPNGGDQFYVAYYLARWRGQARPTGEVEALIRLPLRLLAQLAHGESLSLGELVTKGALVFCRSAENPATTRCYVDGRALKRAIPDIVEIGSPPIKCC